MVPTWKSWCRLCAQEDPDNTHLSFFLDNDLESPYLEAIRKHFSIDVNLEEWPQTICPRCHHFITSFMNFTHRTSKVQAMFAELLSNLEETVDPVQLKIQYELHDLGDLELELKFLANTSMQDISDGPKPNEQSIDLEEIEYIDEEMLDPVPQIKSEDLDDKAVEDVFEENEWLNDQLPSSQPHEEDVDIDSDKSLIEMKSEWENCETEDEDEEEKEEEEEMPKVKKRGRPPIKPICPCCKANFSSHSKYAKHMLDEHGVSADRSPYTCPKCSLSFSSQKALHNHEITNRPACADKQKSKIPCPFCDKQFTKITVVQTHIQTVHSGEKPFICEECGKGCKTFGALKEHKLTHTEDKPFKCSYCDKSFKNNARLKTHMDTHNETNYICTSCGLQLNTRRTLKMHMLVHSDQKRHKCDYCGNEFKRAKALKNHLILHTGLKPYTCNFCDKTFANGSNCRTHKKKSHPVELAAMEAAGTKVIASNIPKLENLRAVTANKSSLKIEPMGSLEEFGSTASLVTIAEDVHSLKSESQHRMMLPSLTNAPPKMEQHQQMAQNNWQQIPNS